jgi:hypothetical protein
MTFNPKKGPAMTEKKEKPGNGKDAISKAAATREEAAQNAKALNAAEKRLADIRCARREEKQRRTQYENDRVRAQNSKKEWEKSVAHLGAVIDNDQLNLFRWPALEGGRQGRRRSGGQ